MDKKNILTRDGFDTIVNELENRKNVVRKQIADEIEKARQQGDLSENAAYKAAMEEKEYNETKISDLEEYLANSIVQEPENKKGYVAIGSIIIVEEQENKQSITYKLVGESESDPLKKYISIKSPIGIALNGRKNGDIVEIITPMKKIIYKIIEIK